MDDDRSRLRLIGSLPSTEKSLTNLAQNALVNDSLSLLTHQLRNNLSIVLGYSTLIQQDNGDDRLCKVIEAARRAESSLRDWLRFTHSGCGKEALDVEALVRETLEFCTYVDKDSHIDVGLVVEPLPPVRANASQIRQVISSLYRNAVEAITGTNKKGRIVISLKYQPESNTVRITVSDDGQGIPDELTEKIFEPFFSTSNGAGLGLAIAAMIVKAHGGRLEVSSCPDCTRFTFELNCSSVEASLYFDDAPDLPR